MSDQQAPSSAEFALQESSIEAAANHIRSAERVVVFTGAGMSAASGIATFRGGSGLWNGLKGTLGLAYFGTPFGWKLTPGFAWSMYLDEFYAPIAAAAPHAGHLALARLEKERFGARMGVVTMNVDGLHQDAGSSQVVEVHGSVQQVLCTTHGAIDASQILKDVARMKALRCPTCHSSPRPGVVLFTESLPSSSWREARTLCRALSPSDVMLVVGTTNSVYPAAGLPEEAAARGVKVIEVNLEPTPLTPQVSTFIRGGAERVLPLLVASALAP